MAEVALDGTTITDWESFHSVSARVFGFPAFYGRNLNAWIDCLTYLDDGMSRFNLPPEEDLRIEVTHSAEFRKRAREQFDALVDAVRAVNSRNAAMGERGRLVLSLR